MVLADGIPDLHGQVDSRIGFHAASNECLGRYWYGLARLGWLRLSFDRGRTNGSLAFVFRIAVLERLVTSSLADLVGPWTNAQQQAKRSTWSVLIW